MARLIERLHAAAESVGRDPATLPIVCRGSFHVTDAGPGRERRALWGSIEEIRDDLARYGESGVTELFLDPNFQPGGGSLDRVLRQMEAFAPGR
jgi:alkanesulfonate monooxygenase SsuD/methylene tetrahydromethanopterin reductase-like flavin-dependent oxidoreductase (luciferase family)